MTKHTFPQSDKHMETKTLTHKDCRTDGCNRIGHRKLGGMCKTCYYTVEEINTTMNLFQLGEFLLQSDKYSGWKINCDAFTEEDWRTLAFIAADLLPPFGMVEAVPTGGLAFADQLRFYADPKHSTTLLIAEDVLTTGGGMERVKNLRSDVIGVCVFAREAPPTWVTPIFQMRSSKV